MRAYIVTLPLIGRQRLRAGVVAASSADACKIVWRCALATGYTPIGVSARPVPKSPCA